MSGVFISYRRDDSAAAAGRLYDRLAAHFGKELIFRDLDAIAPGAEFTKVIEERVSQSNVLIAVIGKEWLNAKTAEGQRRLDDPKDYVKAEIREALNQKKLIIPALIAGANIPKAEQLPEDIAALAGRNAIEISESRFDFDAGRVIEAAEKAGVPPTPNRETQFSLRQGWWARISNENNQRTWKFIGGGIAAVVPAVWAVYLYLDSSPTVQPTKPGQTVTATSGGVAAGGNVTATSGGIVNTGSNNTFNIGITLEQYEAGLKRREQEIRAEALAELAQPNGADKARIAFLEKKLAAAEAKLQNPEQSFAETNRTFAGANNALEKFKGDVPADQLAQAKQALQKGDAGPAKALFGKAVQSGKQQAAEAAFQLGELANDRIDYATAYQHYLEAARLQPENAAYLDKAGLITLTMGRYEEALPFLMKALAIREKSLGPEDLDVATSLNNLGELYREQGQYGKAEPLYQRSLKIREKSLGPEDPAVATSLNNLALLYLTQGQYAKAEPLYQRSLEIWEKSLGPEDPAVATSLNNLAVLYRTQGQYAKAEPLYQRSLKIWEKSLRPEDPYVASGLNNLGVFYFTQGQYAKAEPLYQRSLKIREKSLGPEHPNVATSLNNLAELYRTQGQYAKAEPLYQRSLKIREKSLGPEHLNVAQSLENYAALLAETGRTKDASRLAARARAIRGQHQQSSVGGDAKTSP